MDVVGNLALVHDRIHTGDTGLRATRHAPESVGAAHKSEGGGGGAPHDDGERGVSWREFGSRPMGCGRVIRMRRVSLAGCERVSSECSCGNARKSEVDVVVNERHDSSYQSGTGARSIE